MAQIFSPSSNVVAKISIVGALMAVPALGASIYGINMVYGYKYYIPVEQPVQFSHKHHVGDDGIDCRYCHTSVEKSFSAGMPSTHTCMSCHSQIWSDSPELQVVRASYASGQPLRWNRVHDMPDFVYFNHSIHIKKGVGCETCHGRVDEKPLMFKSHSMTMSWCLDCHRQPEKFLRPREAVFTMGYVPGKTTTKAAGTMGIEPKSINETATGRKAALEDISYEQLREREEKGEGGAEAHVGKTQLQIGLDLKKQYKIRSARELTDCGTCHR